MLRTIWGDNDRYIKTYWEKFRNRYYVAGDSARRDKDGYYWIMGRIDDVLNIAGHRLGTMEIESALAAHSKVAEAAVVSKPHDIKGESAFAYVVLNVPKPQGAAAKALIDELRGWVGDQLSPIAKPDEIRLTDNLPKTRSGKIMRRLLRAVARGEEITQDMSTLENPAILDQLHGVDSDGTAKAAAAPKKSVKQAAKKIPAKAVKKAAKRAAKKATKRPAKTAARAAKPARAAQRKAVTRKSAPKTKLAPKRAKPSRPKGSARRKK
jgi:hypothetical protein